MKPRWLTEAQADLAFWAAVGSNEYDLLHRRAAATKRRRRNGWFKMKRKRAALLRRRKGYAYAKRSGIISS